jgi:hypothetical protein
MLSTKAKFLWRYNFTHSSFWRYMVVVIQLHTHVNLPPQQELPVPFEYEVDWAQNGLK